MSTARTETTFHLDEYIRLLLRLDRLILEGEGDSGLADEVRDEMEMHWRKLTPEELKLTDGLAIDLPYTDEDGSVPRSAGCDPCSAVASAGDHQLIQSALQSGDWDRVLTIIRENESQITTSQAAALRGIAWDRLGHPEVAALFFEEAARLEPNDLNCLIAYLRSLVKSRQLGKAKETADEIASSSADPLRLFLAADVLFDCASVDWPQVDLAMLPRVVEIAERASSALQEPPTDDLQKRLACSGLLSLAISKDLLNDGRRAAEAAARARHIFPSPFDRPDSPFEANGSAARVGTWADIRERLILHPAA